MLTLAAWQLERGGTWRLLLPFREDPDPDRFGEWKVYLSFVPEQLSHGGRREPAAWKLHAHPHDYSNACSYALATWPGIAERDVRGAQTQALLELSTLAARQAVVLSARSAALLKAAEL